MIYNKRKLGEDILKHLEEKKISEYKLSQQVGCNRTILFRIRKGKGHPCLNTFGRICSILNTKPNEYFND